MTESEEGVVGNSWFTASWSEVQVTTWDLQLVCEVGDSLVGLSP